MTSLTWHPHLSSLLMGLALVAILGWLAFLHRRYAAHHSPRTTWILLGPKMLMALFLFLAIFDPTWRAARPRSQNEKILVLVDASSSMDVADSPQGTRAQRAAALSEIIDQRLRSLVNIEKQSFDTDLPASQTGKEGIRGTDLGKVLASLSERPDMSAYRAVVLLTDGGDEPVLTARMPGVPLFIAGVGTDPSTWNDVALIDVDAPPSVEEKTSFEVVANIQAYKADRQFAQAVQTLPVALKEQIDGEWQTIGQEKVDVSVNQARVNFRVKPPSGGAAAGSSRKFQVSVATAPGELSTLNNERTFTVDVRKRSFFVLLYARKLDWDFALLYRELKQDPAIKITALYRASEAKKPLLEGDRQEGDEVLDGGFPADPAILKKYKCVILGSFPAEDLDVRQQQALVKYVADGGSAVFLGGPDSFGRGGYDQTPLAPLLPWNISRADGEMLVGKFPVTVPPHAADHAAVASLGHILKDARSPLIYSVNPVGKAHAGTLSLLDASVSDRVVPLVALQRFGNGQTLGIASNTLWRWGRMEGDIQKAFHQFWENTIRYLSGMYEGNRFLMVKWDRPNYRPSEAAEATMQVAGRSIRGQLRFTGTVTHGSQTSKITIEPVAGTDQVFKTRIFFPDRGEYLVRIEALAGFEKVDTYERTLRVSPTRNEGARLEVDHGFLNDLAGRGGGLYVPETEIDRLIERLRASLLTGSMETDVRLVEEKGIFFFMVLAVLAAEWVVRRRMNLF